MKLIHPVCRKIFFFMRKKKLSWVICTQYIYSSCTLVYKKMWKMNFVHESRLNCYTIYSSSHHCRIQWKWERFEHSLSRFALLTCSKPQTASKETVRLHLPTTRDETQTVRATRRIRDISPPTQMQTAALKFSCSLARDLGGWRSECDLKKIPVLRNTKTLKPQFSL